MMTLRRRRWKKMMNTIRKQRGKKKNGTIAPSKETLRHYAVLGLQWPCDASTIKKRFAELCLVHHPDVCEGNDDTQFRQMKDAYNYIIENKAYVGLGANENSANFSHNTKVPIREIRETNYRLRRAVRRKNQESFFRTWGIGCATSLSFDFATLMIAIEGMELFYPHGPCHTEACFKIMDEWEANLTALASVEAYDRILLSYADLCRDSSVVMQSVEQVVARMDSKGIQRTEWTNHLIHRCMHMCIWTGTDYQIQSEPRW
eukprot:PhF_6_TR33866/c0_g1_i1/m.49696